MVDSGFQSTARWQWQAVDALLALESWRLQSRAFGTPQSTAAIKPASLSEFFDCSNEEHAFLSLSSQPWSYFV
jgi:hypothetical protein